MLSEAKVRSQTGLARSCAESEIVDGVICSVTPVMLLGTYPETYKRFCIGLVEENVLSPYGAKNTSQELYQAIATEKDFALDWLKKISLAPMVRRIHVHQNCIKH